LSALGRITRWRRFAFGLVAAMSLAIGAATAWLCIESANLDDYLTWAKWYDAKPDTIARYVGVDGHDRRVSVFYGSIDIRDPDLLPTLRGTVPPGGSRIRIPKGEDAENVYWRPSRARWGFFRSEKNLPIVRMLQFTAMAPGWFVILATMILPVAWLVRLIRKVARPRTGHCPVCGYDLRGSPLRCPECGTETPAKPLEKSKGTGKI